MKARRSFRLRAFALLAVVFATSVPAQQQPAPELLVLAAASLTDVLQEITVGFEKSTRRKVKLSFAASSALARQIEAGGAASVFVSADPEWMDYLAKRGLVDQASRRDLVGNRLVLIAPADSPIEISIRPGFPIARALGDGRLSVADPDTVPAGRYARAALTSLGVWDSVSRRLVRAENVRAALMYVSRGEAPLGIVYATDARVDPRVRVVATFPENSHDPITYPAATTVGAGPGAAAYLDFLGSDAALAIWKKRGFVPLQRAPDSAR